MQVGTRLDVLAGGPLFAVAPVGQPMPVIQLALTRYVPNGSNSKGTTFIGSVDVTGGSAKAWICCVSATCTGSRFCAPAVGGNAKLTVINEIVSLKGKHRFNIVNLLCTNWL